MDRLRHHREAAPNRLRHTGRVASDARLDRVAAANVSLFTFVQQDSSRVVASVATSALCESFLCVVPSEVLSHDRAVDAAGRCHRDFFDAPPVFGPVARVTHAVAGRHLAAMVARQFVQLCHGVLERAGASADFAHGCGPIWREGSPAFPHSSLPWSNGGSF
jgi:hypothetical protein